jgi:hypothetical protein
MLSSTLLDKLMPEDGRFKKSLKTGEERVEEALQKALDNDTLERPGVPWEETDEDDRPEDEWL